MATWCLINGLKQKTRFSQTVATASRNVLSQNSRVLCRSSVIERYYFINGSATQSQCFHTSKLLHGKRSSGKRNPLKTKSAGTPGERIFVHSGMTAKELAAAMKRPLDDVRKALSFIPNADGSGKNVNTALDNFTITNIVKQNGLVPLFVKAEKETKEEDLDVKPQPAPDPSVLVNRPPVVTIMGHVDHGKTTLLDQLRNSNIVDKEFGGITQHIGAFSVTLGTGESICFLDTPGHAAFSAMRSRGAQLTDIVVLVVAADDGVMQQTMESIHHAKEAGVPIIVAINKIDKANADVDRTKQMLMEHDILLEEFGGDIQAVEISALKGINLLELQEAIVTQAEIMSLKGDPKGQVEAKVVESRIDEKRGRLVTAVIQRGSLKRGDLLIAGTAWAKVRSMFNDMGKPVQVATPGTPVEILGWKDEIPSAGEEIRQLSKESEVKSVLSWRKSKLLDSKAEEDAVVIQERREEYHKDYHARLVERRKQGFHFMKPTAKVKEIREDEEETPQLPLILKGDVDGSVEAILDSLDTYRSTKCRLDIIHYGVGNVSEADIDVASTFDGEIYAFNVDVPAKILALAKSKGVLIRQHNIIYRLFEDLKADLTKRLPKLEEDVVIGEAKVLQVYKVTLPNKKKVSIAGCRCTLGNMSKKYGVKLIRDNETLYTGRIESLKHFKDEVESIKKEQECGICLDDDDVSFQPQDQLVCFDVKEVDQEIDWEIGF